jgi:hypothetical protein
MLWEPVWQVSSEPTLLKYIGPFDQITIVLSLEPVQLEEILIRSRYRHCTIYQECELYTMCEPLSQSMVNVEHLR